MFRLPDKIRPDKQKEKKEKVKLKNVKRMKEKEIPQEAKILEGENLQGEGNPLKEEKTKKAGKLKKERKPKKEGMPKKGAKLSKNFKLPKSIKFDKLMNSKAVQTLRGIFKTQKIQTMLVGAFLVPVFFIVVLGVVSYQKASETIVDKYEESSVSAISAEALYFSFLCETVSNKANEVIIDDNTSGYYEKYYKGTKANDSFRELRTTLIYSLGSANYIHMTLFQRMVRRLHQDRVPFRKELMLRFLNQLKVPILQRIRLEMYGLEEVLLLMMYLEQMIRKVEFFSSRNSYGQTQS